MATAALAAGVTPDYPGDFELMRVARPRPDPLASAVNGGRRLATAGYSSPLFFVRGHPRRVLEGRGAIPTGVSTLNVLCRQLSLGPCVPVSCQLVMTSTARLRSGRVTARGQSGSVAADFSSSCSGPAAALIFVVVVG